MARKLNKVIGEYEDQFSEPPSEALVNASMQLLATCVMQSSLGMGPLFPEGQLKTLRVQFHAEPAESSRMRDK